MRERNLQELVEVVLAIRDKDFMLRFLEEILTPAEIDALVLRWELVKLLYRGMPQREISKQLGISLCKITRGSRELKKTSSAIREILRRVDPTQADEYTKEDIDDEGFFE